MREKYNLGPSEGVVESYEVTAEWSEESQRIYLEDWNPYDGVIMAFFGLSPNQMEALIQWWEKQKSNE